MRSGKKYQLANEKNTFYLYATFYSAENVAFPIKQMVFSSETDELNHVEKGYSRGNARNNLTVIKAI